MVFLASMYFETAEKYSSDAKLNKRESPNSSLIFLAILSPQNSYKFFEPLKLCFVPISSLYGFISSDGFKRP